MADAGVKRQAHVAFVRMGNNKPFTSPTVAGFAQSAATLFGLRVREFRKAKGMSQEGLAEALSLSGRSYHQTTIAKLESGSRPTSIEELYLLAVILDVPATDLVVVQEDQNMEGHRELIRLTTEIGRLTKELAESTQHLEEAKREYEELTRSMGADLTGDSRPPAVGAGDRRAEGRFEMYKISHPPDATTPPKGTRSLTRRTRRAGRPEV
jgi:transcriptional regulator with XRE-family HTH domain